VVGQDLHLTPRQLEVIHLLSQGYDSSEIATELGITPRTVKVHCDAVRRELGVKSRGLIPNAYRAYLKGEA
jgi:DNA-binding CsgD family transcriptional regulator